MTKIKELKIPSPKGFLAAVLHTPENEMSGLSILCPGYLDSKKYKHLVSLAEVLSNRGYAVVRFDPTGTWESSGEISDYTTTQYLEDIKSVLDFMLNRVDYKQVILGGHSLGGMVSILYAAQDPRVSLVLGIMPPSQKILESEVYNKWGEKRVRVSLRDIPGGNGETVEFRVPYSFVEDRKKYDLIGALGKVKVPLILVAGERDKLVPPREVRALFSHAHEPKTFIVVPGVGHGYRGSASEVEKVNKAIEEALAQFGF